MEATIRIVSLCALRELEQSGREKKAFRLKPPPENQAMANINSTNSTTSQRILVEITHQDAEEKVNIAKEFIEMIKNQCNQRNNPMDC